MSISSTYSFSFKENLLNNIKSTTQTTNQLPIDIPTELCDSDSFMSEVVKLNFNYISLIGPSLRDSKQFISKIINTPLNEKTFIEEKVRKAVTMHQLFDLRMATPQIKSQLTKGFILQKNVAPWVWRDLSLALSLVSLNGTLVADCSRTLKNNDEIAKKAIETSRFLALSALPEKIKNNPEIVLSALENTNKLSLITPYFSTSNPSFRKKILYNGTKAILVPKS